MVKTGIDMVKLGAADSLLTGRLGLLTNHSGVDAGLTSTIDILHERFNLTALFAPEHGVRGAEQAGFTGIRQYAERKLRAPKEGEERIFFLARKGEM